MPDDIVHKALGKRGFYHQNLTVLYGFEAPEGFEEEETTVEDGGVSVTLPDDEDDEGDGIEVILGLHNSEITTTELKIWVQVDEWEAFVQQLTQQPQGPSSGQISRTALLTSD